MTLLTKSISILVLTKAVMVLLSLIITSRASEIVSQHADDKIIPLKCDNDYGVSCTFFNIQAGGAVTEVVIDADNNEHSCNMIKDSSSDHVVSIKQFDYFVTDGKKVPEQSSVEQEIDTAGHTNDGNGLMYPPEMKTYIEFVESSLERIPDKLFKHYSNVLEFIMRAVGLRQLDAESFYGATHLESIDLSFNRIRHVTNDIFSNLTNVHRIDLSYNTIATIEGDTFRDLSKLNYLDLTSNCISELPSKIFNGLTALEVVALDHNQLKGDTIIGVDLFETNINLVYVSLQHNQLTQIGAASFANLTQLQYLRLSYNHLKEFDQINFVTNLYVSHNDLELLKITSNIKVLDAQYNQLYDLECDEVSLSPLLSTTLPSSTSKMEILLLNNNHLNNFHCIEQMSELIILNLAGNEIKLIKRNTFLMVTKLINLQLENNKIKLIEFGAFAALDQLEYLNLSNNLLKTFDLKLFPPPGHLVTFLIENNQIGRDGMCALINAFHEFIVESDVDESQYNCSTEIIALPNVEFEQVES